MHPLINNMTKAQSTSLAERSWILYDVANSAFVLAIVSVIMPLYFKEFVAYGLPQTTATANWGFANATAACILTLSAPFLGALGDYQGNKKKCFTALLVLGLMCTLCLGIIEQGQWKSCLILFIFARVGWSGANLFYDSFLLDVTSPERMNRISAMGYAYGFIGGAIPFIAVISLIFFLKSESILLPPFPVKIGFVIIVSWWFVFSLPLMRNVHQIHYISSTTSLRHNLTSRLISSIQAITKKPQLLLFFLAYFFYIDGVGTIISMAAVYGRDLGFSTKTIISAFIASQFIAFPFTLLYGRLSQRFSIKSLILFGIALFSASTIIGFTQPSISDPTIKISLLALSTLLTSSSIGGVQALSRSLYAQLIPAEQSAQYFGFYNVVGKFAAIMGPLMVAVITKMTGHSRWGWLSILVLFIVGATLLRKVKIDE